VSDLPRDLGSACFLVFLSGAEIGYVGGVWLPDVRHQHCTSDPAHKQRCVRR
jgi:hypothetical protein